MTHEQWVLVAVIAVCALVIGIGLGHRRGRQVGEQRVFNDMRVELGTDALHIAKLEQEARTLRNDMSRMLKNQMNS